MSRRLNLSLAIFSAVLYIAAFPNFNLSGLAFVALVPLALVALDTSPRHAFLWGWLSGTLAYGGLLYWIVVTFRAAHLSWSLGLLCLFLLAAYLGLYWAAWSWLISWFSCSTLCAANSTLLVLFASAAWVTLEYARTYLFSGFPWALLADSQVRFLPFIQIASVTGVYGVSFLIVLMNSAIARGRFRPATLAIGLVVLNFAFGYSQLTAFDMASPGRPVRVALLQGSIDQYKKWDKVYVAEIQKTYEKLVRSAGRARPTMVIWPETSVPGYLLQDPPLRKWLQKVVRDSHTCHLVGAPSMGSEKAYNSAFSINAKGYLEGQYAKQHLVPFGEIVPWARVLGRFIRVLNDLGGFSAGELSPVIPVGGIPVGVNICYEAIFPNLVRKSVKAGAQVIANLTNDGWYMCTAAPYQHWAPNIFRAVENRRWVIRADNTGVSGSISPTGRVQAASAIFEPGVILAAISARSERTLYTQWGDVFAWLCVLFCVVNFFRAILRRR